MLDQQKKTVKVFVKNPEKGKVKTRLAASLGDAEAMRIYKLLLNYTRDIVLQVEAKKQVWYSDFIDHKDEWSKNMFSKKLQTGFDLGERMKHAFKFSFEKESSQLIVLIGSDCAELSTGVIEKAFEELKNHKLVLGPAEDGGYYLIGMSEFMPDLFEEVEWSTEHVLSKTISKAEEARIDFTLLPELRDVDTIEDWEKVKGILLDD